MSSNLELSGTAAAATSSRAKEFKTNGRMTQGVIFDESSNAFQKRCHISLSKYFESHGNVRKEFVNRDCGSLTCS